MELERGYFRLLSIFFSALAISTDKMKVVLLCFPLRNAVACAMLPDVALFTSYAVSAIVLEGMVSIV